MSKIVAVAALIALAAILLVQILASRS